MGRYQASSYEIKDEITTYSREVTVVSVTGANGTGMSDTVPADEVWQLHGYRFGSATNLFSSAYIIDGVGNNYAIASVGGGVSGSGSLDNLLFPGYLVMFYCGTYNNTEDLTIQLFVEKRKIVG